MPLPPRRIYPVLPRLWATRRDFALAWSFGVAFQYFTIVPMRELGRLQGIWQAIKAGTLSIVAFQAGLFAAMGIYHLVIWQPPLVLASPSTG